MDYIYIFFHTNINLITSVYKDRKSNTCKISCMTSYNIFVTNELFYYEMNLLQYIIRFN